MVAAAVVAAVLVLGAVDAGGRLVHPVTPLDVGLVLGGCLAVIACRRAPAIGLTVVAALMLAFVLRGHAVSGVDPVTGLPEIHSVRERATLLVGWFVAAGVAGAVSRHRRAYLAQVEERAAEAERTREETVRRRAVQERLRIARELHDSLTHSISVVKVRAAAPVRPPGRRAAAPSAA
ncbi:MAG: hypothetical protein GEV11_13855 [Streptosporangiales bacterium]|nr:hypothetical protein [Streptosporangiales bacterium]